MSHVACVKNENAHKSFVRKPKVERLLRSPSHRSEYNIKTDVEVNRAVVCKLDLTDSVQRTAVNTIMNLRALHRIICFQN